MNGTCVQTSDYVAVSRADYANLLCGSNLQKASTRTIQSLFVGRRDGLHKHMVVRFFQF